MKPQALGQFRVVVGPASGGQPAALVGDYCRILRPPREAQAADRTGGLASGRRGLWIAPTRAAAIAMREAVADQAGAVLDPGVTTFADVAAELLRDAGQTPTRITSLQRRRLISRVIAAAGIAGELEHFAALADRPGMVALVDEGISQLQQRGLSPGKFERRASADGDARDRDLARLFQRYADHCAAAGFVDSHALVGAAAAALAASPEIGPRLDVLIVDGFSDFTTVEFELLRQLGRRSRHTVVTLPGEEDAPALRPELFGRPRAATELLVRKLGAVVERQPAAPANSAAFAHLKRHLFRRFRDLEPPTPAAVASLDQIHIVAASGLQAEIVEIARRVKRRLAAGTPPNEIIVAFRSTHDVAERVRQVFTDYGIPFSIDAPRRLAATQLVRTLGSVLRLAADNWPYRRLLPIAGDRSIRLLDGDAELAGHTSVGYDDAGSPRQAIELCVRHAQLANGRRPLLTQLDHWSGDADRTADPRPADAALAKSALSRLAAQLDVLPQRATLERWIAALGGLANGLGILRPATAEVAANWAILVRGLQATGRVDAAVDGGAAELTLAEFLELLIGVAAQAPAASTGDTVGRVLVASAESARLLRPRHLLLGGLTEQAFPAPPRGSRASNSFDDADAARSAEMLLFYQLVTGPTDTLTVSYAALDERAQAVPASPFLLELERTFGQAQVPRTEQPLNYGTFAARDDAAPLAASELRRHAVAQALEGQREPLAALVAYPADSRLPPAGAAVLAGIEAVAHRSRRDEFGSFDGVLASPAAAAQLANSFGAGAIWSPSRLERYAECPFLFFGEHLLHLKPAPELVLASDVRRRGSLLHAALAQLYAALRDLPADSRPGEPAQLAANMVEQFGRALAVVAEARPGRGVDAAIREIERRQIAAWAEEFARQDAEYSNHWQGLDVPPRPAHFEVRFGPGSKNSDTTDDAKLSTNTPLRLEVTVDGRSESVHFTGQIDRIDVGRVGDRPVFNVIDYKTGARSMVNVDEVHAGRQIQLPLYALAVERLLLTSDKAVPLSAGYWSVLGDGYRVKSRTGRPLAIHDVEGQKLSPASDWSKTHDRLVARIGEMIAAIRRGEFPVYNDNPQCTNHCEFRTVCRIAQVRSLEKRWPMPSSNSQKIERG
jgi:ATP-dependent helicase/nuclease subunit B